MRSVHTHVRRSGKSTLGATPCLATPYLPTQICIRPICPRKSAYAIFTDAFLLTPCFSAHICRRPICLLRLACYAVPSAQRWHSAHRS